MISSNRSLLVLFKTGLLDEKAMERQVECLNKILVKTDSPENFCTAHELVDRNRVTSNKKKLLKESKHVRLRPFRFLINKN